MDQELRSRIADVEAKLALGQIRGHANTNVAVFGGFGDITFGAAEDWLTHKLKSLSLGSPSDTYHKGDDFKGLVFMKFANPQIVEKVVDKMSKESPKLSGKEIWCKPDRPIEERAPMSFLLGLRWHLIEWNVFAKREVKVDEDEKGMRMTVNGRPIVAASVEKSTLKVEWVDSEWKGWDELQNSSELANLMKIANERLASAASMQTKGKGKGPAGI